MSDLDEIRRCSVAVYLAADKEPADDISRILRGAADEIEKLRDELALWRPLTNEEAEKAFEDAEAVPLSEERIAEIVAKALDPAEWTSNPERMQMAAKIKRDAAKLATWDEMREALAESHALNINWSSDAEPEVLEYYSEYRAVIKQANAVLAKIDALETKPKETV